MDERQEVEEWVLDAKRGNKRAKEKLLQQFKPLLIKSALRYFGMNQDFDDWLQEGRIVILKAIDEYQKELGVPFTAYVQKQVFYYFINERKKVREEVILDQPLKEGSGCRIDLISDSTEQVEEDIMSSERKSLLIKAMASLSPKQREVIIFYYLQEKKLKVLAKEKDVCYQTLVKLKARALENLRREIGER